MSPPRTLGDYELLDELGAGGMGTVYRARHAQTKVEYALKTLHADTDAEFLARFQREGEGHARVDDHPNVVRIHTLSREGATAYLVMDLAAGGSLEDRLARGLPPVATAAGWIRDLALAVEHAHRQGVLHRDLKPHNVLFDGETPKLTDFGLAKLVDARSLTETGSVLGTPAYMAPEQAEAGLAHPIGPATDVYGLGALLYRCLTGQPPFRGRSVLATLEQVLHAEPTPPRSLRPEIPVALEAVCLQALAKDPSQRPASAHALAVALEGALRAEVSPSRRPPALLLGAGLLGALALGASLAVLNRPAPRPGATAPPLPAQSPTLPPPEPPLLTDVDLARRQTECPGPHALDVRRARAWLEDGLVEEAQTLLRAVLSGAPCRAQAKALRMLGVIHALGSADVPLAERCFLLAALGGDSEACWRLELLWLPPELRDPGERALAAQAERPDARRAGAALWLAARRTRRLPRYADPLDELAPQLPPPPSSEEEALERMLAGAGRPDDLPALAPTGPDPVWSRPDADDRAEALYRNEYIPLRNQTDADPQVLQKIFGRVLDCPPSRAHAKVFREWGRLCIQRKHHAPALQFLARAALMGDAEAVETLGMYYLPRELKLPLLPLPGIEPDDRLALAAIRLALDWRPPENQRKPRGMLTEAKLDMSDLPSSVEAYQALWAEFPDAR